MTRWVRYILGGSAAVVILPYSAAVGYLSLNETALVFAGAGREPWGRWLPADNAGITWDSLRTQADDGVPVFLVESRLDDSRLRPWAIYFHGNAGLLGSRRNVARYQLLREAGFNVLAVTEGTAHRWRPGHPQKRDCKLTREPRGITSHAPSTSSRVGLSCMAGR